MEKFSRVLEQVRRNYVDEDKVTYNKLMEGALRGMLSELDPHSEYMPADRHKALLDDTRQEFGGIGIVVSMRNNWLTIISPMDDTPGARAGLQPGDRIIKIEGKSTEGTGINEAVDLLRGKIGTKVKITIYRSTNEQTLNISLKRERIKTKSVRDLNGKGEYKLISDKIGYAKLSGFSDNTSEELEEALVKMEEKGMRGLVLDLRDNPGGLLSQSARVTEKFVKENQLIVSTEGRNAKEQDRLIAKSETNRGLPLVVLVNEGSASASEIVAGCLQDLKRAKLVGAKTFGKGSVQSILPMRDGSALRLTTAKYFTPSHRTIHNKGIEPDYAVKMTPEQMRDIMMKRSPGVMETLESEEQDRVANAVDPQLAKALEILSDILKAN
jgi:carboxyl-terminal processing protease